MKKLVSKYLPCIATVSLLILGVLFYVTSESDACKKKPVEEQKPIEITKPITD